MQGVSESRRAEMFRRRRGRVVGLWSRMSGRKRSISEVDFHVPPFRYLSFVFSLLPSNQNCTQGTYRHVYSDLYSLLLKKSMYG
jgi:hypothetical protein